jgi:hypothetical protein
MSQSLSMRLPPLPHTRMLAHKTQNTRMRGSTVASHRQASLASPPWGPPRACRKCPHASLSQQWLEGCPILLYWVCTTSTCGCTDTLSPNPETTVIDNNADKNKIQTQLLLKLAEEMGLFQTPLGRGHVANCTPSLETSFFKRAGGMAQQVSCDKP